MCKKSFFLRSLALSTLMIAVTAFAVSAQHVQFKTKSKMKLESLGFIGSLMDSEFKEEVSISGNLKRVDRKDESTITDLDQERIIELNHDDKTYTVMTFAEMMEMLDRFTQASEEKMEEVEEDMEEEMAEDEEAPRYTVEFDLRVEETGESEKIDGKRADQKIMIIETRFIPEDEAARDSLPSTALFVVNDLWLSNEVPEMKVADDFNRRMAEILQREFTTANMSTVISALLKSDPRVSEAMDKAQEELREIDGTTLKSKMYFVTVPIDKELDLDLVLGKKKKKGGGLGGFLKQAAKLQMGEDGEGDEEKELEQSTIFSMESVTEDISDKARDDEHYQIPDDYKEVKNEMQQALEDE